MCVHDLISRLTIYKASKMSFPITPWNNLRLNEILEMLSNITYVIDIKIWVTKLDRNKCVFGDAERIL